MITILGRTPSKKNSRINTKSGRSFPSKAYSQWHKDASMQLLGQEFTKKDSINLYFYMPDNRRADLTNKAESVMDLLVDNRFLGDDSWQETGAIHLYPMGIDRINPRVVIE